MKRPSILITNDDGIHAPGLRHLWEALVDEADVYIVAPSSEKSGVGSMITLRDPILIEEVKWDKGTPAWKISGTPADCIRMSLTGISRPAPDLIVSGINKGSNCGRNIYYSGTIGAVMEGVLRNVPGISFSCCDFINPDYKKAVDFIPALVRHVLEHPLPNGTLLNVNFPETEEILGVRLARQGKGFWIEDFDRRIHPEGHSYYWHGGKWYEHDEHEESDVHLLKNGYATAVPLHVSEITDFKALEERKSHFERLFDKVRS